MIQKKENQGIRDEIAKFKKIIQEKQQDEEVVDINKYGQDPDESPNRKLDDMNKIHIFKESDDAKISRFERIIDQLTKMIDTSKK